jgi:hypothetical protein
MIADLDETIKKVLVAELPIKNGEIDVKFEQPKREWSAKLTKPTVNFFMYDVRENAALRQANWQAINGNGNGNGNGNSPDNIARSKKTPLRVDCYYMMTTWASEPEDEHRLLSRCLMAMYRHPILPEHMLVGTLQHNRYEVSTGLARHDKLTNPAEVWSALDNEMRPSVSYIVTLALDPWAVVTGPVVRTFTIRSGQTLTLPVEQELHTESRDINYIGGTVRRKKHPQPGLEVAVKGTGWFDKTDDKGQFTLGGMPPGEYTLVVWPGEGKPGLPSKPIEKAVQVPATEGDYDIEL